ncbi:NAD-dependent epimerase/dehydratase [Ancylobacter novellus DSM 506]|uniref:NAD-dependent epimerase/dehydratase n=1 Tax=Ancylobacter novellus (strain ATCC 8093 / DSM 506 / JCM 20403 / CCM 1077 / IAM 12100 / NBRC 12443 / NCIMB 10456) TaxID=639283 RepID=D7A8J6_ANCN5|nr:NAD(P)-dependent oxidoreductase [Ancylobacter novellus]ADH90530.1 NAD-dependent epimerase/dehydratase [Ancylobacter novellus DSM 506]
MTEPVAAGPVLLTGASGTLGRLLAERLTREGRTLVLTDLIEPDYELPAGVRFMVADLADREAVLRLGNDYAAIVHFGAVSTERDFADIFGPNIAGAHHIFDLARASKARVIFASSNHAIGFNRRDVRLDEDCDLRPDGYYGLSKAYGELLARLYWDKHGLESLSLRIGSCVERPTELRHLSTWLSFDDLVRLVEAGLTHPALGCRIAWGVSANSRAWWVSNDEIGTAARDDAERFAGAVVAGAAEADPVSSRYQGGTFCASGYDREEFSPQELFGWRGTGQAMPSRTVE